MKETFATLYEQGTPLPLPPYFRKEYLEPGMEDILPTKFNISLKKEYNLYIIQMFYYYTLEFQQHVIYEMYNCT